MDWQKGDYLYVPNMHVLKKLRNPVLVSAYLSILYHLGTDGLAQGNRIHRVKLRYVS
jgi:hypothetical protein